MLRSIPIVLLSFLVMPGSAQVTYEVRPAGIRPAGEDYAPSLMDSTLVFCSLRFADQVVRVEQADTEKPLSDLYSVPYASAATVPAVPLGALNTVLNDGPATFAADGTICFTSNTDAPGSMSKIRRGTGGIGLFFAARAMDPTTGQVLAWTQARPFEYNSPEHRLVHPSLSADGHWLYFASDLPGGQGGMDLYRSEREGTGWGLPENLGPSVNSEANDLFPFIHQNGSLYFTSDREGGPGRLDIYRTEPKGTRWMRPEALPEPMNSAANDLGYTSFATDVSGAFSSDRLGADEVFLFSRTIPRFVDCQTQILNNYCYQFKEPMDPSIGSLPLRYEWDLGDGTRVRGENAEHCYARPGRYVVERDLVDTLTNTVFFTAATHTLVIEETQQPYVTSPDSARTDRPVAMDALHSYLPQWTVEDIRWRMPDGEELRGASVKHRLGTAGTLDVLLDVMGTDRISGELKSHCVARTIQVIDRFKDSEDVPVYASYQDASGVTREFAYQALPFDQFQLTVKEGEDVRFSIELFASKERISLEDPRFIEIRKHYPVIERFDPERGEYTYSVGEAKSLGEMYDIYKKVKELRFLDAEVLALDVDKVVDLSMLSKLAVEELDNTVVRTSTVYFATNRSSLDPRFIPSLSKITDLLREHDRLTLVIEAHTDDKGTEQYNRELSDRRAQALVDHFIAQGVDATRLTPIGHGEAQPIAANTQEKGRAKNRRVEFRLNVPKEDQARMTR
ncbi:MAG: OmpA family protein [Flavobacteriales bacterium]|nr:OmpA family protein [Flavobacteriales bacterium]